MTIRRLRRAVALIWGVSACLLKYAFARLRGPMTLEQRAYWLQGTAKRVMACLGIESRVEGQLPNHGLVVSNHLSYIDIVLIGAAMPCFFVSKKEVAGWPLFGWAATLGGTLFLDRSSYASASQVAEKMAERLTLPVPILLFPEGTSTDGARVLKFRNRLIFPATQAGAPITAAAVAYRIDGGEMPERELCWYGDENFGNHLWKVLGVDSFTAILRFGSPKIYDDGREAGLKTHAEVTALRGVGPIENHTAELNSK